MRNHLFRKDFRPFDGPHVLVCWQRSRIAHSRRFGFTSGMYIGPCDLRRTGIGPVDDDRKEKYPLHPDVLNSKAVSEVFSKYGCTFCPQAFPEGSPQHPSYGQVMP